MREFVVFAIAERGKLHQHIFASRQDRVSEVPTTVEHRQPQICEPHGEMNGKLSM